MGRLSFKKKWAPDYVTDQEAQVFILEGLNAGVTFNRGDIVISGV